MWRPTEGIGVAWHCRLGRQVSSLALALWTTACVNWSQPQAPAPQTLPASRQVRVWTPQHTYRLHAVHFTPDSIIGVPFQESAKCDSCRVAVALASVDSIQTGGSSEAVAIAVIAVPLLLMGVIAVSMANSDFTF